MTGLVTKVRWDPDDEGIYKATIIANLTVACLHRLKKEEVNWPKVPAPGR